MSTAASDVLVARRSDGTLWATPFYARFSRKKLVLPTSSPRPAFVFVNGSREPTATVEICGPFNRADDDDDDSNGSSKTFSQSELQSMPLREGANPAVLSAQSRLRGEVSVEFFIHLWSFPVGSPSVADGLRRVVVSDIDGTVTRSDLRGHVLRDHWVHRGVARLFAAIARRGYRFVYLSARPLSQVESTRRLLSEVEGCSLPPGPVFVSGDNAARAIIREVARPEQLVAYKTELLQSISAGLGAPEGQSVFAAGFGNRETDGRCYAAAGINTDRIILVDEASVCQTADGSRVFVSGYGELADNPAALDALFPVVGVPM